MKRLLSRKFLTLLVLAAGVLSVGASHADSPTCTWPQVKDGRITILYFYGPTVEFASGGCGRRAGGTTIMFYSDPAYTGQGVVTISRREIAGDDSSYYYPEIRTDLTPLPDWAFELVHNHQEEFRKFAPSQLAMLEQRYPALAQGGASGATATRSTATSSPSGATSSTGTNSTDASADISSQCRDTDRQTTRRYLTEANAAMQRGDMAAANRANLASSRAKLELYQGRCASASDARDRIASANQGISMVVNLCNSAGLGSNCGGSSNSGSSASGQAYSGSSGSSGGSVTSGGSSGNIGVQPSNNSRYGYLALVNQCIELKNTRRESIAQWYSVTNTCSMKVKFFTAPDTSNFGNLKELSPGQTDTSWHNYVKKPNLPWVACPADAPNGNSVSVEGDSNGPVSCRYFL